MAGVMSKIRGNDVSVYSCTKHGLYQGKEYRRIVMDANNGVSKKVVR